LCRRLFRRLSAGGESEGHKQGRKQYKAFLHLFFPPYSYERNRLLIHYIKWR
jgi:hypothetical protein